MDTPEAGSEGQSDADEDKSGVPDSGSMTVVQQVSLVEVSLSRMYERLLEDIPAAIGILQIVNRQAVKKVNPC